MAMAKSTAGPPVWRLHVNLELGQDFVYRHATGKAAQDHVREIVETGYAVEDKDGGRQVYHLLHNIRELTVFQVTD